MGMDDQVVLTSFVNEMDAQILVLELEGAGIEAFIQKDDCGGMRPFITAERGIEVLVFRKDLAKAQELVGNVEVEDAPPVPRSKGSGCLSMLIAVVIAFSAGVFSVHLINYFKFDAEEYVAFTYSIDRNHDGKDDQEIQYDVHGVNSGGRGDNNFDGKWDVWWSNEYDQLKSFRGDTDFNRIVDYTASYELGVLKQVDWTPNGSSSLRREFYKDGILQYELLDEDRDGNFDLKVSYDPFMNVTRQQNL